MSERLSRAARQQILKDDAPWVGKPLAMGGLDRALQANTRHLALLLSDTRERRRASQAAMFALRLLDATAASGIKAPAACAKGCSHCCRTLITATIPEILRLARAIKGRDGIVKRVADAAARSKDIAQSAPNSTRVVCPILEENLCSQYAARPIVCRSTVSSSRAACVRIFDQDHPEAIPSVPPAPEIRATIVLMLQTALRLAGLPHQNYELTQGLAIALADDGAEARWLSGEPMFAAAEIDQADTRPSRLAEMAERLAAAIQPSL
ncbi:MAG: YkgJ family cysteine cluster protein [Rhodospirillaceae bacterium]|nr:YkgJ family cysteine cluster protein [Rhodospirillaceae bacterium]